MVWIGCRLLFWSQLANFLAHAGELRFSNRNLIPSASLFLFLVGSFALANAQTVDDANRGFDDSLASIARSNASLHAIASINESRLIAVGDRGLILRSDNAGRNWNQWSSPTSAHLYDVKFADEERGWIVGGEIGPFTHCGQGVILETLDGGESWHELTTEPNLPCMYGVEIRGADAQLLIWGNFSSKHRSCILQSSDGGQSWQAALKGLTHASAAGVAPNGDVLAFDSLGRVSSSGASVQVPAVSANQRITSVVRSSRGWIACGEAGELLQSHDGVVWVRLALPLNDDARSACHWRKLVAVQDTIWLVGSPGSILGRSQDGGLTWELVRTGQRLPINSISFVDARRGWSVGALGNIWATRDGGENWYPLRQPAQRAAVMNASVTSMGVPWTPLLATAWENQQVVVICNFGGDDPIQRADYLPSESNSLASWSSMSGLAEYVAINDFATNLQNQRSSQANILRDIFVQCAIWQPDVILGPLPLGDSYEGLELLLESCVGDNGTDDTAYAWWKDLNLTPWKPIKLVMCRENGEFSEQDSRLLSGSGITARDGLQILPPHLGSGQSKVTMHCQWTNSNSAAVSESLMGGIPVSEETRFPPLRSDLGNYQTTMGRPHRVRSLSQLLLTDPNYVSNESWQRNLEFLLQSYPRRDLDVAAASMYEQLCSAQRFSRLRAMLQSLTKQSDSDATQWALWQSIKLFSSSEFQAWIRRQQRNSSSHGLSDSEVQFAGFDSSSSLLARDTAVTSPFERNEQNSLSNPNSVVVASNSLSAKTEFNPQADLTELEDLLEGFSGVSWRYDYTLWKCRQQQKTSDVGQPKLVGHDLANVATLNEIVGWPQVAAQELQLEQRRIEGLRWLGFARRLAVPPKLNGELSEDFWNSIPPMQLTDWNTHAQLPASQLRWAYDDQYLYIGLTCPVNGQPSFPPQIVNREYDRDLSGLDRVEFTMDVDRDYCTAFDFAVAITGETYDQCCNLQGYNPSWHVATGRSENSWTAEIAISLEDVIDTRESLVGQAWAVSVRRHTADGISQSWSQLRTHSRELQGAGLLVFLPSEQ